MHLKKGVNFPFNPACWDSADMLQYLVLKSFSGTQLKSQTVGIQKTLDLSWVQTVCKSYQLPTLVGKGLELSYMLYYQELKRENRYPPVSLKDRKIAELEKANLEKDRRIAELVSTVAE